MIKDALILSGGDGNRFRKTNNNIIKPLYKIGDKELIRYTIDPLLKLNMKNIYINENQRDNLEVLSNYYDDRVKYIKIDNTKGPVNSLYRCLECIDGNFILCDCDTYMNENDYMNMIQYGIDNIDTCDGYVACSLDSLLGNNGYIDIKDDRILTFDKRGIYKYNGGFTYVLNNKFKEFIIKNKDNEHLSILLDEYFKNYNVKPMYINSICDIDNIEEARVLEKKLIYKHY